MKRSKLVRREVGRRRAWKPLVPATHKPKTPAELEAMRAHSQALFPDISPDQIDASMDQVLSTELWTNGTYDVHARRLEVPVEAQEGLGTVMVHLSIKRVDREPVHDWRDLQRIKNQLVGEDCEAIELYPAESRLVDTANSYHLWCLADSTKCFPFGWFSGRRVSGLSGGGAVQRPLDGSSTG